MYCICIVQAVKTIRLPESPCANWSAQRDTRKPLFVNPCLEPKPNAQMSVCAPFYNPVVKNASQNL
jgi:hypothetical protein